MAVWPSRALSLRVLKLRSAALLNASSGVPKPWSVLTKASIFSPAASDEEPISSSSAAVISTLPRTRVDASPTPFRESPRRSLIVLLLTAVSFCASSALVSASTKFFDLTRASDSGPTGSCGARGPVSVLPRSSSIWAWSCLLASRSRLMASCGFSMPSARVSPTSSPTSLSFFRASALSAIFDSLAAISAVLRTQAAAFGPRTAVFSSSAALVRRIVSSARSICDRYP